MERGGGRKEKGQGSEWEKQAVGKEMMGWEKNIKNREELMRQMLDRCEGKNQAGDECRNTAGKQQKTPQNPRKHTRHK